ncbi:MAG TPA: DNA polymerase IV [Aggregatilinea sp.]|uniref:DNA polymerase IV n=1 Tax=Aggregatilinea sp. TaxID=2806333 RepID=UPI002C03C26B|nr:DNA polymerase IV [Aggregatilinea sp.]HML20689.1 DNA polymerase IV [Aggregatilinea sp.]
MAIRKILHLDLDAFFCCVEEQRDPSLRGQPFAVGGRPDQRGVVASCSYAARQFGIHSAMPMVQAVRRCPDLIIVRHDRAAYSAASHKVMQRLHTLTPLVEQLSIDEAFLDVSLLPGPAERIARDLQGTINEELNLPCSLGVATNKLVAKIANTIGKGRVRSGQPPNAITVVPPGEEAAFLAPLPVSELWGVGPKTEEALARLGIRTIADLARWPADDLAQRFGKNGESLARHARGIDERPVEPEQDTKSISRETTFTRDIDDGEALRRVLRRLADGVGWQARRDRLAGTTIKLKLRWADFTTLTRQVTLDHPTNQDDEIYTQAEQLFTQHWPRGRAVRLIGVSLSGFEDPHQQLGLWDDPHAHEQKRRLQATLDDLRERFGEGTIKRGSDLDGEDD